MLLLLSCVCNHVCRGGSKGVSKRRVADGALCGVCWDLRKPAWGVDFDRLGHCVDRPLHALDPACRAAAQTCAHFERPVRALLSLRRPPSFLPHTHGRGGSIENDRFSMDRGGVDRPTHHWRLLLRPLPSSDPFFPSPTNTRQACPRHRWRLASVGGRWGTTRRFRHRPSTQQQHPHLESKKVRTTRAPTNTKKHAIDRSSNVFTLCLSLFKPAQRRSTNNPNTSWRDAGAGGA